ncbi:MAG: winged helix-turn-helix transcriptional regulator [Anaerolineales bacterium]|nr:winged helix-turn-helix transcriptional regulator [Anaerolineales bacterium]
MAKNLSEGQLRLEKAAETMKALADPYRLHILDLLTEGEACHSELKERVGLPPNLLSHHLRVLRQSGLVRTRHDSIDGRWIYYVANKDNLAYWRVWLGQFLDPARVQARQQTIESAALATINTQLTTLSRYFKWALAKAIDQPDVPNDRGLPGVPTPFVAHRATVGRRARLAARPKRDVPYEPRR